MTNEQKFKTPEEREKAFDTYCRSHRDKGGVCGICPLRAISSTRFCVLKWLALEAEEEKPLPCPYCGAQMDLTVPFEGKSRNKKTK